MTTFAPMTFSLPLPTPLAVQEPCSHRARTSTHVDSISRPHDFWDAVKVDTPPTASGDGFESTALPHNPPLSDEGSPAIMQVQQTIVQLDDNDPIIAFETFDCYSPDRTTFSPAPLYDHGGYGYDELHLLEQDYTLNTSLATQPCPFGELIPQGRGFTPAPTLGAIQYHDSTLKPPSRQSSPRAWLRSARFKKQQSVSASKNNRQQHQSAVAALTAAFLDGFVKLGRSRSSTPTTTSTGNDSVSATVPASPARLSVVRILESEVLVNVLEDDKRVSVCEERSLCSEFEQALERFYVPPFAVEEGVVERGRSLVA